MTEQTASQRIASHWSITCATEICAAVDKEIASAVAKERGECAATCQELLDKLLKDESISETIIFGTGVAVLLRDTIRARTPPQAEPQENV